MGKKKNILIIDDDQDYVDAVKTILVNNSYEVSVAHNGKEGLEKIITLKPDCVLLDIMMENQFAGLSIAYTVKHDPAHEDLRHIPIIYVSAIKDLTGSRYSFQPPDEDVIRADEYLDKPVEPRVLIETIERLTRCRS